MQNSMQSKSVSTHMSKELQASIECVTAVYLGIHAHVATVSYRLKHKWLFLVNG